MRAKACQSRLRVRSPSIYPIQDTSSCMTATCLHDNTQPQNLGPQGGHSATAPPHAPHAGACTYGSRQGSAVSKHLAPAREHMKPATADTRLVAMATKLCRSLFRPQPRWLPAGPFMSAANRRVKSDLLMIDDESACGVHVRVRVLFVSVCCACVCVRVCNGQYHRLENVSSPAPCSVN
jgi:hypothetical protein